MTNKMDWVKNIEKEYSNDFFKFSEGDNKVVLLTHCAKLVQKWNGTRYEIAQECDKNVSIKGLCWVLQDNMIKLATLPYTVVKQIKEIIDEPEYQFTGFPMNRMLNIKAKNAGTIDAEYVVIPSPKEIVIPEEIRKELEKKTSIDDILERMKEKQSKTKLENNVENKENPNLNPDEMLENIPF